MQNDKLLSVIIPAYNEQDMISKTFFTVKEILDGANIPFECIFVDDCKKEADGAREQGFTAFFLDRNGENDDEWTIYNLKQLIDFVEGILI